MTLEGKRQSFSSPNKTVGTGVSANISLARLLFASNCFIVSNNSDVTDPEFKSAVVNGEFRDSALVLLSMDTIVYGQLSLASHTLRRERVWSHCNYRVVAEERNYRPLRLGNKLLTSAKHIVT